MLSILVLFAILVTMLQLPFFAEDETEAFEKCHLGEYNGAHGLGSWTASVGNKLDGKCLIKIFWEVEGGYTEEFCTLAVGSYKATDWNQAWQPLEIREEFRLLKDDDKCHVIKTGNVFWEEYFVHLSPAKQRPLVAKSDEVICKMGLELMLRQMGADPACVKPNTAQELSKRGWGIMPSDFPEESLFNVFDSEGDGQIKLYFSNQSTRVDPVDVTIYIDENIILEGIVYAEDFHRHHSFNISLPIGPHTIKVESKLGNVILDEKFEVDEDISYATISYYNHKFSDKQFVFKTSEYPPGFI